MQLHVHDLPAPKLIHPSFSNKKLLENSSLVTTIAGTSGFEAAFYEKHSIVFADTIYTLLPSVHRIREIEKLPNIIRTCLSEKVNSIDLDKFLILLEEETFDFDLRGFNEKILAHFFNDGELIDREISEKTMIEFLTDNEKDIEKLSLEYLEKLNLNKNEK